MKAKTKFTRLWSILLALVMVVGMLPTVALAEGSATADFTSGDGSAALDLLNAAKTGDTPSTWDGNTLTLNGVNFETTAVIALKLPAGATIVVNGANIIKGGNLGLGSCYGIYGVGNLTIQGTGTLNVTCAEADSSYGIRVEGNLTITDSTVTATGGTANSSSYGIYTNGSLTISDDADVTATGGSAGYDSSGIEATNGLSISGTATVTAKSGAAGTFSYGISVNTMSISGTAKVKATGDTATNGSCGIYAYIGLTISGTADVTANGGTATNSSSYGIFSFNKTEISGGTVNATGGEAKDDSYGIRSERDTEISGGTVTATGGEATTDSSYGIYSNRDTKISGGTTRVTANGGTANYSCGIYSSYGSITISGGTVTAKGGEATGGDSYSKGISSFDAIEISDGTVTAEGDKADYSYGIYSSSPITISNGTVTAKGGEAKKNSYGIIAPDRAIIISGGTVTAEAKTRALYEAPSISISTNYWWRTSESDEYTQFSDSSSAYTWSVEHTYVEIRDTAPAAATTYTVTFDANGGTGTMADVSGVSGTYNLPANGFTAPAGKRFKCWSVNSAEKAVGATINVTANTTVTAVWETIVTAVWETIPATSTEYDILDGANSSWTQNSDGSLSIRGSGAFSEFVGVKVDGKSVDEQYYTVKEGSTIVTLKAEYLSTLAAGRHDIQLMWKDGTASTTFNINVNNPNTGDNGGLALAAALLALSAAAIATSGFNRKRGKSSR